MAARTTVVTAGRHRIEANVFGSGSPVVVIEPSFGGVAAEWRSIAETLSEQTTVVTYDRVPIRGQQPGRRPQDAGRHRRGPARGARSARPVRLRSSSSGSRRAGFTCASTRPCTPATWPGWSSSSPATRVRRRCSTRSFTWRVRLEGALFYPQILFSTRAKREGADRLSMMREWRAFRGLTAADRPLAPGALGDLPLAVITRADGGPYGGRQWQVWHEFHSEQAQLSANSHHVISRQAEHGLHESDPDR